MQTIKVRWTGIRPMIMHNGSLADPTNTVVRRIKEITSKGSKKMTESDYEERDRLEWFGGVYWSSELGLVVPSDNIERCIQLGAQKSRLGKDVQAAVLCAVPEVKIEHGGPKTKEALYADARYAMRKTVVVNKGRVPRVRPMVPTGWSITFDIEFDDSVINGKSIVKAMVDAGSYVGLGNWRPKFGRFIVEIIED